MAIKMRQQNLINIYNCKPPKNEKTHELKRTVDFKLRKTTTFHFTPKSDGSNSKQIECRQRPVRLPIQSNLVENFRWYKSFYAPLFLLLAVNINLTAGCPTEIRTFCACVDESDGVLLNCSMGANVVELLQTMRVVQSQIGLLKSLSIRNSKISILSNNLFSGLYIKRLEMVNCKIRSIEDDAFSGLESILLEINLSNNLLEKIPIKAFKKFNSLIKLDLSNNSIGELKSEDALPNLQKLFDVDLSHNKITNIHKSFFESTKNSLQTINLGHNTLSEVPASALRGFRQLMALHLHNNLIRNLSALSFMNLPMLSLLNLASNRINNVHKQAFLNAPNLRFLYMTDNQLTKIQPYQFASFEQLEMIDLSNNKIVSLDNDSFSNLKALKQLYLGENLISHVDEYAFENSSVVVLILESNQLSDVTKDIFKGASKLQQLSLKDNKVKNIDPNAFYKNHALVMLDLSHNEIMDLAPATFLSQMNMLLLDLSYNKLTRTPYSAFSKRITTVLLQENPLVCTERMHMIQQGVGVFVPNTEDVICGKPKESIKELTNNNQTSTITNETTHNQEDNINKNDEESAFKQLPIAEPQQPNELTDREPLQHLTNIRPLTQKKISTAQINQFIDQSQFQTSSTTNKGFNSSTENQNLTDLINPTVNGFTNPTSMRTETVVKDHPFMSGFSHFLQHTTSQNTQESTPTFSTRNEDSSAEITKTENIATLEPSIKSTEKYDIAHDPNQIYPLPVPFLTRPPKLHTSRIQNPNDGGNNGSLNANNIVITQTLPPSILIAPKRPHHNSAVLDESDNNIAENTDSSQTPLESNYPKIEQFEFENNIQGSSPVFESAASGKFDSFAENDHQESRRTPSRNLPTAVTVICLSTVALVMCVVFVGLCVAKRRQVHLIGSSADSSVGMSTSPNGYPAHHYSHMASARAAQMNAIYGSGTFSRSGTLNRLPPLQDDIYGWMYPPTAYNVYANK